MNWIFLKKPYPLEGRFIFCLNRSTGTISECQFDITDYQTHTQTALLTCNINVYLRQFIGTQLDRNSFHQKGLRKVGENKDTKNWHFLVQIWPCHGDHSGQLTIFLLLYLSKWLHANSAQWTLTWKRTEPSDWSFNLLGKFPVGGLIHWRTSRGPKQANPSSAGRAAGIAQHEPRQ